VTNAGQDVNEKETPDPEKYPGIHKNTRTQEGFPGELAPVTDGSNFFDSWCIQFRKQLIGIGRGMGILAIRITVEEKCLTYTSATDSNATRSEHRQISPVLTFNEE
jgi:hypothetical protein